MRGLALAANSFFAIQCAIAAELAPEQSAQAELEAFVITGSRIIRDGYQAPTPLSVIDSTATVANPTINDNSIAGFVYVDTAFSYKFAVFEETEAEAFLNIRNIANKDPGRFPPFNTSFYLLTANTSLYDTVGRVFRTGLRFKM